MNVLLNAFFHFVIAADGKEALEIRQWWLVEDVFSSYTIESFCRKDNDPFQACSL